jgi:hypothetical protein
LATISSPGPSTASFCSAAWAASSKSWSGLKPNFDSTQIAIANAPPRRRTALMICTQVVAIMPPRSSRAIITEPTTTTATV